MPLLIFKFMPIFVLVLIFANCQSRINKTLTNKISSDSIKKQTVWPDTPDFPSHIAPLLSYFNLHKNDTSFDTLISFTDQGFGPIDYYYNFTKAGHLFSSAQTHALVFYDIGIRNYCPLALLIVYKKNKDGIWEQVLLDTVSVSNIRFRYKDWNNDGIGDLSYFENGWWNGGHGPITWYLWLVDNNGNLHKVKGFEDLDDPKIDSFTNHIFTNTIVNHEELWMQEFKFSGNRSIKLWDIYEEDFYPKAKIKYYSHEKLIKSVKHSKEVYVPKHCEDE